MRACLLALSLVWSAADGTATEGDIAIVVSPDNPVGNLTLPELRKIYLGERQYWKAETPIVPLMRSTGAREREVLLRVVFQMSPEQYTHYWVGKVMRAEAANPPAAVFSFGMMHEGVRGNPGAIGYVNFNDLRPGVKVLRIDGLLPGAPGYALR